MKDLIHELVSLGFSEKEAAVYIAALEKGIAGAHEIGRRAGVNRATTYSILNVLADKGLITPLFENGERRYRAEPPQQILTILHLQQREIEQKRQLAGDLVLRLQVFHNVSSKKPIIRYHESFEGIRTIQKEHEALDADIIQIVGFDTLRALRGQVTNVELVKEMERRARKIRAIVVSSDPNCVPDYPNVESVIVPPELLDIKGEMSVCGDRLALFSYTSGIIVVEIQSKTIADTARATLELAWQRVQEWQNKQASAVSDLAIRRQTNA